MAQLPRGVRIDHGYVQVRIFREGLIYCKNFGKDSTEARELATIHLADKRREFLRSKVGIEPEAPSKTFSEVSTLWLALWAKETDPDGKPRHTKDTIYKTSTVVDGVLVPRFGRLDFDKIRAIDVQDWRDKRVQAVAGTTANREQAILSSIFSHIEMWVKSGKIKAAFKLPSENPTAHVEKAPGRKRERVLSKYECSKLKLAFTNLEDTDGWEICKMALLSVLSTKDLKALEIGQEIDIDRAKTGVPVNIPVAVLVKLNFKSWSVRWTRARESAGLLRYKAGAVPRLIDRSNPLHVEFRDLRKTGINWLKGRHDLKLISEYAGHSDIKTTQESYTIKQADELRPLAEDLRAQVEGL